MYLLRDANPSDLPGLERLAAVLDTVNLPHDRKALESILDFSTRSFAEDIEDPMEREYLFVLEEPKTGELLGTSMILAQHGTRESPHVFYEVSNRQTYSSTLDAHFEHTLLSLAYDYDGPTEIGGLVVKPEARGKGKPGKQLSYVRFLFIGMHRPWFRDQLIAELLPPLLPDGRSLLWEALGKKFTGLGYGKADRLSRMNKEFIKELFPQTDIWATLFSQEVQELIGQVGPQTQGVKKMLEDIGFEYAERIDPFDGGPHFEADTDEVSLIAALQVLPVAERPLTTAGADSLVGLVRREKGNHFRAMRTQAQVEEGAIQLPAAIQDSLGVGRGDEVGVIPFP
jgi:arginine N-succinyltransferase